MDASSDRENPTVAAAIDWGFIQLSKAEIETPRLDAQLLLAFAMKVRREDLARDPERILTEREKLIYEKAISLRANRRPLPYIMGEQYFYGRSFKVNRAVLIPRPETEMLVDFAVQKLPIGGSFGVADIGTGSGCIAVSVACEMAAANVVATDISRLALLVAAKNIKRHGVGSQVELIEGDLLDPLNGRKFAMILSNPPYIPQTDIDGLMPEVRDYEPRLALSGNDNSTILQTPQEIRRRLMQQSRNALMQDGWLAIEVGIGQSEEAAAGMVDFGYSQVQVIFDHGKIGRLVVGCFA